MQPCPTGYANVPFKRNNSLIISYVVGKRVTVSWVLGEASLNPLSTEGPKDTL